MGLLNPHLDDDAFAQVWTDRLTPGDADASRAAEQHLHACAECRARYSSFAGWLETLRADALADADDAFGAERLGAQHAQIMRRLEVLEHPARVIAFPRFAQPISAHHTPRRRWVAVAAAAGLVVGVGLGQMLEFGVSGPVRQPQNERIVARTEPVAESTRTGAQPISQVSDEAFFYDQEMAPSQVRVPESLQYLNAITPSARDYEPR